MSHKIIGLADSSNAVQTDYIKNQLKAINNWNPELETQFNNENCELLSRFCKKPARLPTFIIMKNDVYKTHIHGKVNNNQLFEWLSSKLG